MSIALTWAPTGAAVANATISDDAQTSLNSKLAAVNVLLVANGMPPYIDILDMLVGALTNPTPFLSASGLLLSAMNEFPPAAVAAAIAAKVSADNNAIAAVVAYVQAAIVRQLAVLTLTVPGGTVSTPYSQQLTAAGGSGTGYTWAVTVGSLPAGLALSSGGLLSGTPTTSGTVDFTVRVTDSAANTATQALSVTVGA